MKESLIKFENPKYMSEEEIKRQYPNSRYLLMISDITDKQGRLIAVSTSSDSYSEICKLKVSMAKKNKDKLYVIEGYYPDDGRLVGVINRNA